MTLVLTVQTKGSLWLLADRRLSAPNQKPIDDAVKASVIEVIDGTAIVGYAGLGATALGTQPSQWVSNVLRGRHYPLERMLEVISDAMQREFLPHLRQIKDVRQRQHQFIIPAYINDAYRLYSIELDDSALNPMFRYTRHIIGGAITPKEVTVPFGIRGTGSVLFLKDTHWYRPLLRLVSAYNQKRISAQTVGEHLAQLNYQAHKFTEGGSVGPNCVVVWRNSRKGLHGGGGGQTFYKDTSRVKPDAALPTIASGLDVVALTDLLMEMHMPSLMASLRAMRTGGVDQGEPVPEVSVDEVNQRLDSLPSEPDEKLR